TQPTHSPPIATVRSTIIMAASFQSMSGMLADYAGGYHATRKRGDAPQNASSEAARSPVCIRSADEGCGSEHDNSRDECCHAGIRQDFIENSGHCNPPCGFRYSRRHLKATPAPWRKGEILRARAVKCA